MSNRVTSHLTAIGVMSGTSMDAIDVALIESNGENDIRIGPSGTFHYPAETRAALIDLITNPRRIEEEDLSSIERAVTDAHCHAVEDFLREQNLNTSHIDLVGFHGQTVLHRPERRFTCQLLDGSYAAKRLRIDCVNRFRHRDVEAGGQGAPLAPLYHLARTHDLQKPLAILNLGGVANVTLINHDTLLAFDTGPASAMMDDLMRKARGLDYDADGAVARSGEVNNDILAQVLNDPYFAKTPPKSLDRNDFHRWMTLVEPLDLPDAMATLLAFTIESITKAGDHAVDQPKRWLVGGGGRHNKFLMQRLRDRLQVPVDPVEVVGWNGDMLEAECFAWLAIRSIKGLPLSLPSTTGVQEPMTGGVLHHALRSKSA
jgi:anhydro-N-acetylmuramic acid kinase